MLDEVPSNNGLKENKLQFLSDKMLKLHYKLDAPSTTDGRGPSACCLSRVGQQGSEHAYLGFSVEAAMTATTSDMKQHTSKV